MQEMNVTEAAQYAQRVPEANAAGTGAMGSRWGRRPRDRNQEDTDSNGSEREDPENSMLEYVFGLRNLFRVAL